MVGIVKLKLFPVLAQSPLTKEGRTPLPNHRTAELLQLRPANADQYIVFLI